MKIKILFRITNLNFKVFINNSSYVHKNAGISLGNVHWEKRLMFLYIVPAALWRMISPEGVSHMTVQKVAKGSQLTLIVLMWRIG